jgi:hypothetical protein
LKHARTDYDHIQDPSGKIPLDEPVFIIRAQDITGAQIVRDWALLAQHNGAKMDIVQAALDQADAMEAWVKKKIPDMS